MYDDIKAEAFKEFAEMIKGKMRDIPPTMEYGSNDFYYLISEKIIDKFVKEMEKELCGSENTSPADNSFLYNRFMKTE